MAESYANADKALNALGWKAEKCWKICAEIHGIGKVKIQMGISKTSTHLTI